MNDKKCNFSCLGKNCPNHCCGAYEGITPNLQALGNVSFTEIILLPKDVELLLKGGYKNLIKMKEQGIASITTGEDGTCAALHNGRCSIYEYRPSICRAYPLYLDMYVGACALKECPCVDEKVQIENHPEALENLLDVYQYWIDSYRKKKK